MLTLTQIVDNLSPDRPPARVLLEVYTEHYRDSRITRKDTFVSAPENAHLPSYKPQESKEAKALLRGKSLDEITYIVAAMFGRSIKRVYIEATYDNGDREASVWRRPD